jgi:ATP-binding protein involved in chromosome partitioning
MEVPFLGELPMHPEIRIGGDTGRPVALLGESNEQAKPFFDMARRLVERAKASQKPAPRFTVED